MLKIAAGKDIKHIHRCFGKTLHRDFWTEKGALLHAKSLNTDKAWEVYEYLLDFYFRAKDAYQEQAPEPKPKGRQVVDIPENAKAQKLLEEIQKDIAGLEVMLRMYNRYQPEENCKRTASMIREVAFGISEKAESMYVLSPNVIDKVW